MLTLRRYCIISEYVFLALMSTEFHYEWIIFVCVSRAVRAFAEEPGGKPAVHTRALLLDVRTIGGAVELRGEARRVRRAHTAGRRGLPPGLPRPPVHRVPLLWQLHQKRTTLIALLFFVSLHIYITVFYIALLQWLYKCILHRAWQNLPNNDPIT